MNEIATIHEHGKKIRLNDRNLHIILRDKLDISIINFEKKKRFLNEYKYSFELLEYEEVIDALMYYIKNNFNNLCNTSQLSYEEFYDEFVKCQPIKNVKGYTKEFLERDTDLLYEQVDILMRKHNISYSNTLKYSEMLLYLKKLGYEKSIDKAGNYCLGSDMYYKRIDPTSFIVIVDTQKKSRNQKCFDCYKVIAKDEGSFIKGIYRDIILLKKCFEIEKDWNYKQVVILYEEYGK